MSSKIIEPGSQVEMHFRITLDNGFVAEDTFSEEPFEFQIGDGSVIPALEDFLLGMKAGDEGQLTLNPDQAYGERTEENIHQMPRSDFPTDMPVGKGRVVGFTTPSGDEIPGTILNVADDQVTVDFNHPLAGHVMTIDVKVLSVK